MWLADSDAVKAFEEAHRERLELVHGGFSHDDLRRLQAEKLTKLWDRLADVPYFRDRSEVLQDRRLASAPVTPKAALKQSPDLFLRQGAGAYYKYYETSGSTGAPTPAPRLVIDTVWNTIAVATLWARTLRAGDRVAALLPSDVSPACDLISSVAEYLGCTMLRCYPFSQGMCDWDRLESLFAAYRPQHVFVAPGVLVQWTRILKQRRRLAETNQPVESLMLLGEVSTPPLRAYLAQTWAARALDASYGSTETGTTAASCEHDRLHLLLQSHLAEILEGGEVLPADPGRSGELVITTLNGFARPLLRYSTGDLVTIRSGEGCPCGLDLPVLTVHGRRSEHVIVNGTPLTVEAIEQVVYTTPGITGYLVQLKRPDGASARLVLERDVDFSGDPDELRGSVRDRFADLGLPWAQVALVGQLPQLTKAGGSQKNWKRTNVEWVD